MQGGLIVGLSDGDDSFFLLSAWYKAGRDMKIWE